MINGPVKIDLTSKFSDFAFLEVLRTFRARLLLSTRFRSSCFVDATQHIKLLIHLLKNTNVVFMELRVLIVLLLYFHYNFYFHYTQEKLPLLKNIYNMAYLNRRRPDILPYSAKIRRVTSAYRFVYFSRLRDSC